MFCKYCNQKFYPRRGLQQYCSKKCKKEASMARSDAKKKQTKLTALHAAEKPKPTVEELLDWIFKKKS